MTGPTVAQLRLRSAFRYGYFAFLAMLVGLAVLSIAIGLGDHAAATLKSEPVIGIAELVATVGVGLIMPMFLAFWLLVGAAVLRRPAERESISQG